jgi:hypothetical protein
MLKLLPKRRGERCARAERTRRDEANKLESRKKKERKTKKERERGEREQLLLGHLLFLTPTSLVEAGSGCDGRAHEAEGSIAQH